jgi:hypothetical protein
MHETTADPPLPFSSGYKIAWPGITLPNCFVEIVGHASNIPANTSFIWIKNERYGRAELGSFVIK